MAKVLLAVGVAIPGGMVETVSVFSNRSLLDADIVIFQPEIPTFYTSDTYQGKRCLDDDNSFRVREAMAHWRRELAAVVDAGKVVILLLSAPDVVYVATGRKEYSGTGKNARTTRIVETMSSYDAIPTDWEFHAATGSEMALQPDARFLVPYWSEFEEVSEYRLFLDGAIKTPTVRTRSGHRIVGALVRKGAGGLVALPALDFDDPTFKETRKEGKTEREYWTKQAEQFGHRLTSAFIAMAEALAKEVGVTPPPPWVRESKYRMNAETTLETEISGVSEKLIALEDQQRSLKDELRAAGSLRQLLFEQGKPLEDAVLEALHLMGFAAVGSTIQRNTFVLMPYFREGGMYGSNGTPRSFRFAEVGALATLEGRRIA